MKITSDKCIVIKNYFITVFRNWVLFFVFILPKFTIEEFCKIIS